MTDMLDATLMRSGSSRGLYLLANDLPADPLDRDRLLLGLMGSARAHQVDGVGGTVSVTNKVAIVSRCEHGNAEIDYLFAQVEPAAGRVDYGPTCGNLLTGIVPFAIERGLVAAADAETVARVHLVNTDTLVEVTVRSPGGRVQYEGDTVIDGIDGAAAPVTMRFLDCVGSKTGALLPSGQREEEIDGLRVTLVDAAMPTLLVEAAALGRSGAESLSDLAEDGELMARLEPVRLEAGRRMGLGDVSERVIPKIAMLAPPRHGGTLLSRYFTPWTPHPSHAVTGAVAVAVASRVPGTVAARVAATGGPGDRVVVEHAAGALTVAVAVEAGETGSVDVGMAGVIRTVRPIFTGRLYVAHLTAGAQTA